MILEFRGKMKTTNEWIYGTNNEDLFTQTNTYKLERFFRFSFGDYFIDNSLGQYIGLKDTHNNKIYVGDIVNISSISLGFSTEGVVYYDERCSAFLIDDKVREEFVPLTVLDTIEIKGNIFE